MDSWGLGCTVFEAGCGKRLFPEGDSHAMKAAMASINTAGLNLRMRGSSQVCAAFANVMCRMEPAQRWKLAHPFPGAADMAARWYYSTRIERAKVALGSMSGVSDI